MTREEEIAAINEHIRLHGVTRWEGPRPSEVITLDTVEQAKSWARRNGVVFKQQHATGKLSIAGGPYVQGSRFVAFMNGIRARQDGTAVRSDASRLPGSAA